MSKQQYEVHVTFGGTNQDGGRVRALVKATAQVNGRYVSAQGFGQQEAIDNLKPRIADAELVAAIKAELPRTLLVTI